MVEQGYHMSLVDPQPDIYLAFQSQGQYNYLYHFYLIQFLRQK